MFIEKKILDVDKFSKLISHPFKIDIDMECLANKAEHVIIRGSEMQRDYFILSSVHEDHLTFIMFLKHKVLDKTNKATTVEFDITIEELENSVSIRELIFA